MLCKLDLWQNKIDKYYTKNVLKGCEDAIKNLGMPPKGFDGYLRADVI